MTTVASITKKLDAFDPLPSWLPTLALVARYIVGLMFVFSGLAKVMDAQSFLAAMPAYQIPEALIPLVAILPPLEIALGVQLLLGMAIGLTALEFLVAFLQAYVFAILTCMYLNDAIHPSH